MPRWTVTRERFLSVAEVRLLLDKVRQLDAIDKAAYKDYWPRCHMALSILFGTGCRVGELQRLRHKDFWLDEGCLKLNGKGGKIRFVPISSSLQKLICEYTRFKQSVMLQPTNPDDHFLLSRLNRPFSVGGLEALYHAALKKAGLRKRSPHSARHSFGFSYYQKHKDLKGLQSLLGHQFCSTTGIYTAVEFGILAQRVENLYDSDAALANAVNS